MTLLSSKNVECNMQQRHLLFFLKSFRCTLFFKIKKKLIFLGALHYLARNKQIGRYPTENCFARSLNSMKKCQTSPKIQIYPIQKQRARYSIHHHQGAEIRGHRDLQLPCQYMHQRHLLFFLRSFGCTLNREVFCRGLGLSYIFNYSLNLAFQFSVPEARNLKKSYV